MQIIPSYSLFARYASTFTFTNCGPTFSGPVARSAILAVITGTTGWTTNGLKSTSGMCDVTPTRARVLYLNEIIKITANVGSLCIPYWPRHEMPTNIHCCTKVLSHEHYYIYTYLHLQLGIYHIFI